MVPISIYSILEGHNDHLHNARRPEWSSTLCYKARTVIYSMVEDQNSHLLSGRLQKLSYTLRKKYIKSHLLCSRPPNDNIYDNIYAVVDH